MNLNNLQNLSVKQKIFGRALAGILIVILLLYFFVFPLNEKIMELKKNVIAKKVELEDSLFKDKNMADLNSQIKKMEPKLIEIDKIFVNPNRELEFITTLENAAARNNVNQKISINPVGEIKEGETLTQALVLEVSGNFKNILEYLSELESIDYYVDINKLNFSKNDVIVKKTNTETIDIQESPIIRLNIEANIYWKKL